MTAFRYCAETDDGRRRYFPTFEKAEHWARWYVARSGRETYAESVTLYEDGCGTAWVRLDGADRVWTDMA